MEAARGAYREAREDDVLLPAVEDGVKPGAELGERQRVTGQLAIDAVDRERSLQQDRPGDEPGARADRERGGRHEADAHGDRGHRVRGPAPARREARDVARVRADEE